MIRRLQGVNGSRGKRTSTPAIPLPNTGSAKLGGEDESSLTLACTDRSVETPPLAKEGEELQSKAWVQAPDGRQVAAVIRGPLFCSLPRVGEGHVDLPQQSVSWDALGSSCNSSPRTMTLPIVRENSLLAGVRSPRDALDSPGSERAKRGSVPWAEEDRLTQSCGALKRRLGRGMSDTEETLRKVHHKATDSNRYMCDIVSDDEEQSEEDEECRAAVAEKRRRRMLSNRASAQRSRLRRQERLDTLEVLDRYCVPLDDNDLAVIICMVEDIKVAELRVENAALTRKVNTAVAKSRKFEDENKRLLERAGRLESAPLSDSNSSKVLSGTTNENSVGGPVQNLDRSCTQEACFDKDYIVGSLGSSTSNRGPDESMKNPKQPYQWWNNSVGSFDFGSDPPDDVSKPPNITSIQDKRGCQIPDNSVEMNVSSLYQSEIMGLTEATSFQGVDPFGIVLQHSNQEMDRVNLQPRFGEDVWLENLAGDCGQLLEVADRRRSLVLQLGTHNCTDSDCQCTKCSLNTFKRQRILETGSSGTLGS